MWDSEPTVPGWRDTREVLRTDPGFRLLGGRIASPVVLGLVIAALIVVAVVFGPSADSHFIYTDF